MQNITYPKIAKTLPKAVTTNEADNLLKLLDVDKSWQGKRDKALFLLIYSTGLRISEALSLQSHHLQSEYLIIKGNGSKERLVPLMVIVKNAINDYLQSVAYPIKAEIFLGSRGGKLSPRIFQRKLKE